MLPSASSGCVGIGPDTAGIKIKKRLFNFGKQFHNSFSLLHTHQRQYGVDAGTGMCPIPAAATSRLTEKLSLYLTKTTA